MLSTTPPLPPKASLLSNLTCHLIQHSSATPRVWGAAYRIPARHVAEVKAYLDIREINGYSVEYAAFHTPSSLSSSSSTTIDLNTKLPQPLINCLVYIGLPDNPQFLGPQDPDELAAHIARSKGPSGPNSEYVYNLAAALEGLRREAGLEGSEDEDGHVGDLAARVRQEEEKLKRAGEEKVGCERDVEGERETVEEVEAS